MRMTMTMMHIRMFFLTKKFHVNYFHLFVGGVVGAGAGGCDCGAWSCI
jgi:hypothetical protein